MRGNCFCILREDTVQTRFNFLLLQAMLVRTSYFQTREEFGIDFIVRTNRSMACLKLVGHLFFNIKEKNQTKKGFSRQ